MLKAVTTYVNIYFVFKGIIDCEKLSYYDIICLEDKNYE
jgi:hypothetical protein